MHLAAAVSGGGEPRDAGQSGAGQRAGVPERRGADGVQASSRRPYAYRGRPCVHVRRRAGCGWPAAQNQVVAPERVGQPVVRGSDHACH